MSESGTVIGNETSTLNIPLVAREQGQKRTLPDTPTPSETTRYLCAAAHLNPVFRNKTLHQTIEDEYKAIGPSYGLDLPTVVLHCLAARRRLLNRDLLLAALDIVGLCGVLVAASAGAAAVGAVLVAASLLLGWVTVLTELWIRKYRVVARNLTRGRFNPACIRYAPGARLTEKLEAMAAAQSANLIVYGGFSPFVGCGPDLTAWSFAVNTGKGKESPTGRLQPQPFETAELYKHVVDALAGLKLTGITLHDRLYVNGQELQDDDRFLPRRFGRPYTRVERSLLREFMYNPTQSIRHYKVIQSTAWNGELILTVPFRLAQSGQSLFAEASYLLLSPLNPDYHKVDSLQPHPTLRQRATLVAQSLVMTYFLMLVALFLPFWHGRRPIQRWLRRRQTRRVIRENAAYNYGATQSVRESAMSWHYQKYFQKLDTDLYRKVIEQTLLDSIIDFLDGKNIDTSELRERQTTILNNGVMISGSSVSGGSFAAGARARVMSAVGSSTGSGH